MGWTKKLDFKEYIAKKGFEFCANFKYILRIPFKSSSFFFQVTKPTNFKHVDEFECKEKASNVWSLYVHTSQKTQ